MDDADKNEPFRATTRFSTTQWSVVLAAGDDSSSASPSALTRLCEQYWHPPCVFVRRRTRDVEEARDLPQAFFAQLLERKAFAKAGPARGRFRTFLLASLKNFLANQRDEKQALKRGGGQTVMSFDLLHGE